MKKTKQVASWAGAVAVALAFAGAGLLAAPGIAQEQEPMGPPMGMGPEFGGGPPGGFLHWRMLRELNLTEEQQQRIQDLQRAHREATKGEREKLAQAQEAFQEAVWEGDTAKIEEAGAALGTAHAQLGIAQAGFRNEFLQILTPDQQKKWEQMRAEMQQFRKEHMQRMRKRMQTPRGPRPGSLQQEL